MQTIKKTREKPETFVGKTFNNGKLKVIGINGVINRHTMFKVTCEVCSKDKELFPQDYFLSTKGNLEKGKLPCGCSKCPKWEDWQFLILAKRVGINKNFIVHGFTENFKGQSTRLDCECLIDGHKWKPTVQNIVNNKSGCPECKKETIASKLKHSDNKVNSICRKICEDNNYIFHGFPDGYVNWLSKLKYECPLHGVQEMNFNNFTRGRKCPSCMENGYSPNKPGSFYVVKWTHKSHSFLKFGITNRDVNVRIKEQSDVTNYKPEFLFVANFNEGNIPLNIESYIKSSSLNRNIISKELFADGFTETIEMVNLHVLEDLIVESLITI